MHRLTNNLPFKDPKLFNYFFKYMCNFKINCLALKKINYTVFEILIILTIILIL